MHILPGVLALLLLPAAVSAASPFDRLRGEWGGTVSSDNNCDWKVRASVNGGGSGFSGTFTYEGDCAEEAQQGSFTIKPTSKSCYTAMAKVEGMPPIPMTGCADKAGNISFKTVGFSGKLTFSKGGNALGLSVKAERGSAEGKFRRMVSKKKRPAAKTRQRQGGEDNAEGSDNGDGGENGAGEGDRNGGGNAGNGGGDDQKTAPEVLIGGY